MYLTDIEGVGYATSGVVSKLNTISSEFIKVFTDDGASSTTSKAISGTSFINQIRLGTVTSFNGLTGDVTGVTTGTANTFVALQSFTSGISAAGGITFANDIFVNSLRIGQGPVSGSSNTVIGAFALGVMEGGLSNTAVGHSALASATAGDNNVAIGAAAMSNSTDAGFANVAISSFALNNNAGFRNIAIGESSLEFNTSGSDNVAIGHNTLDGNETGYRNTAIGSFSLTSAGNTFSSDNTAIGNQSLLFLNSGSQNTAIGALAGRRRGTGAGSLSSATGGIYIGYDARASADAQTNEIVIGNLAVGLGSNTAVIGRNTQTSATIYGLVNAPSGISASGATLSSNIIIPSGSTLTVNGNFVANGNVNLGDAVTDAITVTGLLAANGGLSAAGGTFSALTRFTAGISASGGMTLAGSLQGSTASFSGPVTINKSSAFGITAESRFAVQYSSFNYTAVNKLYSYYTSTSALVGVTICKISYDTIVDDVSGSFKITIANKETSFATPYDNLSTFMVTLSDSNTLNWSEISLFNGLSAPVYSLSYDGDYISISVTQPIPKAGTLNYMIEIERIG
jgi:hypothetical protein